MLKLLARTQQAPDWPRPADISPMMHSLLRLRGVGSEQEARAFLHPSADTLNDPFLLSDMAEAVHIIHTAVQNGESICVYGDYDVDGVCASAILVSYLRSVGAKAEPYLPSRHHEGYGLNEGALRRIAETHSLLVTVDCGITAFELVECAKRENLKVVVTDHHLPEGELPRCPVVNPVLNDYPFPYLCGAGVAFQLVTALGGREKAMEYIDYAALATIADIVSLTGENRAIAALGLKKINYAPKPGIRALIEAAGLSAKPLSAGNIAFQITPRLNASGRIGDAMRAYKLITSTNLQECALLAGELNEENAKRKALEQAVIDQAKTFLADFDFSAHRALVIAGEDWNPGVIGLAASRLTEEYHYPSIVLTREADVYVGSCRSIEGVDIHEALSNVSELLVKFGGHKMAAGLTVKAENLEAFKEKLDLYLMANVPQETFIPYAEYDLVVDGASLTPEAVRELEKLAPTGCQNPAPVFRMKCDIPAARAIGANSAHLKLSLKTESGLIDGIWFRKGALAASLPKRADVIFSPSVSEYQGRVSVQAEMRAIVPASVADGMMNASTQTEALFEAFLTDAVQNERAADSCVRPLSEGALSDIMNANVTGVLIVAATAQGAKRALRLAGLGEDAMIDVSVGEYPRDARAFRAIAIAPVGPVPAGYHTVILADIPAGLVEASFQLDAMPVSPLFRRMPDVDALRACYACARRITKKPYYFSSAKALIRSISEEADVSGITAAAAMLILADMELLHIRDKGGQTILELPEMVKKNPEDNELYRRLAACKALAEEGGAEND